MTLKLLAPLGGFAIPSVAMLLAALDTTGLKFDGTISLGNVVAAVSFLGAGMLAIAAVPRQVKQLAKNQESILEWIKDHKAWSEAQSVAFQQQIAELTRIQAVAAETLRMVGNDVAQLESRFNNHIEQNHGHRSKGAGL